MRVRFFQKDCANSLSAHATREIRPKRLPQRRSRKRWVFASLSPHHTDLVALRKFVDHQKTFRGLSRLKLCCHQKLRGRSTCRILAPFLHSIHQASVPKATGTELKLHSRELRLATVSPLISSPTKAFPAFVLETPRITQRSRHDHHLFHPLRNRPLRRTWAATTRRRAASLGLLIYIGLQPL